MPTLRVEMFAGRTEAQKRALARELTEATVRALGVPASAVEVLFYDIERGDWAVGGVLCSDTPAAAAPSPQQT
jgi:4-oxalocrotonate tautomerase